MVDQLSLRLESGLPRLPLTLRPMLALPAPQPFDAADHLFEPSWGGARALAFIEQAAAGDRPALRLLDDEGRDVAGLLPELAHLAERFATDSVVADGELVVVDRMGHCDRRALADRLRGHAGPPVAFLAFDLLYLNGRPLLNKPLARRRDLLRRTLRPGDEALMVPAIAAEGRALYDAVVEAGIAGVMGRVLRSPYLPGVRSRLWRFVERGDVTARQAAEDGGRAAEPAEPADGPAGGSTDGSTNIPGGQPADSTHANAPVLALIRRLPLDDAD